MSDGLNQIRAVRIAEIMEDFRDLMSYISSARANPPAEDYNEEGYVLLRRCVTEAQALLAQPFQAEGGLRGNDEQDRANLRRIIADAAVRRFKAQRIYMRVTTALRWVNMRAALLQGGRPNPSHSRPLQQISATFRNELSTVTDQRVEASLRASDQSKGRWTNEDPNLQTLQRLAA